LNTENIYKEVHNREKDGEKHICVPRPANPAECLSTLSASSADVVPEAERIAAELVKLHAAGPIRDASDPETAFYAKLIHFFGASFTGKGSGAGTNSLTVLEKGRPYKLTKAQVVRIPPGLTREERAAFLARDLEEAFADEPSENEPGKSGDYEHTNR
jgi:hypothetical protein